MLLLLMLLLGAVAVGVLAVLPEGDPPLIRLKVGTLPALEVGNQVPLTLRLLLLLLFCCLANSASLLKSGESPPGAIALTAAAEYDC
jgi:hypothetical protein